MAGRGGLIEGMIPRFNLADPGGGHDRGAPSPSPRQNVPASPTVPAPITGVT